MKTFRINLNNEEKLKALSKVSQAMDALEEAIEEFNAVEITVTANKNQEEK